MMIENYIIQDENKTLEFKENFNSKEKILATSIAFANTSGGRIILGIQDKTKHIIGVENPHDIGESIANMLHDSVEPGIIPNIEIIPFRNTHVIVIEIYPSSLRPHYERKKGKILSTYIRIGSTTRRADTELIASIERSALVRSYDEEICPQTQLSDIDLDYIKEIFSSRRAIVKKDLISLGVYTKDRDILRPTIGGILLFSPERLNYFPDAWIQVGLFEGIDKNKIISSHKLSSYFPHAIDECLNLIKRYLKIGLRIQNVQNEELWEIPRVALREAIINAVVHTDYSFRGAPIRVSIFSDRVEIENSALLQWGLTIEDIKSGISKLRNPVIGRVFHELGIIEQWGSGIKRMISSCLEYGLPEPLFEEISARIRITFWRQKTSEISLDKIGKEMIDYIKGRGSVGTQEISNHINLSKRSTIMRLAKLVEMGLVVEVSISKTDPKKKYTVP